MARTALEKLNNFVKVFLLLIAAFLLAGCVSLQDPESSQENRPDIIASAAKGQSFGQSFISRRPGLDGIQLWLNVDPGEEPSSTVIAELFHVAGESQPLAVVLVSSSEVARGGPLHLKIPSQPGGSGQAYYVSLKTSGGRIDVFGRNEDVYPQGQAYANGMPLRADAAFRLSYTYGLAAFLGDLKPALGDLWLALPLAITLLLPGWMLLELSGLGRGLDGGEKTGLAVGLSLAVIPLFMLWTSVIRWTWSQGAVMAAGALICAGTAWRIGAHLARWRGPHAGNPAKGSSPKLASRVVSSDGGAERSELSSHELRFDWISLALFSVFLFSLAVRLIMARDLAAPAWVDSVHHALITRLIVEQGGFPASYAPYLDLDAAGYHPGFHSLAATFHWLSGLDIPSSMLLLGQVLNALSVYAAFLFTTTLVHSRSAGLIAAFITGIFTPMPAYYTSWGRYTQLAGLLILPAALALSLRYLRSRPVERGESGIGLVAQMTGAWKVEPNRLIELWINICLAGAAIGGLFLTHYRVLAFLACLFAASWITQAVAAAVVSGRKALRLAPKENSAKYFQQAPETIGEVVDNRWHRLRWILKTAQQAKDDPGEDIWRDSTWKGLLQSAGALGLIAAVAVLLTLPWWPDTLKSFILPKSSAWNAGGGQIFSDFSWSYLDSGLGKYTLVLAALGFLWGIIRRRSMILILALWVALLFALANPGIAGLAGAGLINNISVEISLFLPIALLGGFFLARPVEIGFAILSSKWQRIYIVALGIAGLGLALIGARHLIPILNPITLLFREADRPAITWVEDHLPEDATILVNPFSWGYGLYAGNDGGFWITPLTGRQTLPPPVLYGFDNRTDNILATNAIIQKTMEYTSNPTALHGMMKTENIGYIFIGKRGGRFSPRGLQESGLFNLLYQMDGVWIFQAR